MSRLFRHEKIVTLREIDHRYFDQFGDEYKSQSAFMSIFKNKFDAEKMSKLSAGKKLRQSGKQDITAKDILEEAEKLKNTWSGLGDHASGHGNSIHNPLELYGKGLKKQVHSSFYPLCEEIYARHLSKHAWFNEQVLFLEKEKIAGTADLPIARTNSLKTTIDIDDFKTNVRRGIEFHSPYGNFMKFPLEHLEDCNYNHYALQMSLYGYMCRVTYGLKVGSLNIQYIKAEVEDGVLKDYSLMRFPVPFMYHEIEAALEYYMAQKEEFENKQQEEDTVYDPFQ